jgi:hypothetical protein
MAFGLEKFKVSRLGQRIGAVLEDPQSISDMIVFSRHEMPAVQAVGKALLPIGREVRERQVKQTIGRWVREILEGQGWTVWKNRRVAPGNLFLTGMVYRSKGTATDQPLRAATGRSVSPAKRAALWREGVKDLPHTEPLSDEAISRENLYVDRGR